MSAPFAKSESTLVNSEFKIAFKIKFNLKIN